MSKFRSAQKRTVGAAAEIDLPALFEERTEPERIAKRLARAGLCSRREAERWIEAGRVEVDGSLLSSAAVNVTPTSQIRVDGKDLPTIEPPRLWRLHKDRGTVTTERDPEGRATVFDALPKSLPRVMSVGRLDMDSEGLLLLTNDGELARYLELPATGWARRYRVRVYGPLDQKALDRLKSGVTVDGVTYGPIEVTIDKATRTNSWITVRLREGKNREIRKVMAHLGLTVSRLIRVSYGPFQLGELDAGEVEEVKRSVLKDQLGIKTEGEGRAKAAPAKSGTNNFGPKKPGAGSAKSGKERMSKADRWATLTLGDKSSSRKSGNPNANNRRKAPQD